MNTPLLLLIACSAVFAFCAQDYGGIFTTYQEMRTHLGELYLQEKYAEAADLLLWARDAFPDYLFNNTYNLTLMYAQSGQYEKGIEALQYGLDRGIWFAPYFFENELWSPLKEQEGFDRISKQIDEHMKAAQANAKPELLIVTPEQFDPSEKYPLFIALHGGSENIEAFKDRWKSKRMSEEFITAYPQSSQVIAMNGFWWHGDIELTRREIAGAYHKAINEYPVDTGNVIVGGFSSGGLAALEIVLSNTIPVAGFIALCPDRPESFNDTNIREAKKRGVRGVLITAEQDERHAMHGEMVESFEKEGLPCAYVVLPEIGHTYPDDLDKQIDQAIDHINAASIIER